MRDQITQAAHLAAIAHGGTVPGLPAGMLLDSTPERSEGRRYVRRAVRKAGRVASVLWGQRRDLHRIAWQSLKMLWTVRRAFPWALRALVVVGCVQIPFLPTDEIAALAALVWIVARYRPLARVIYRAAVLEATA